MGKRLRHLDLFAGIGGFSLGLERSGLSETVAFCEIEPFCQKVLNKHWPDVPIYNDVRELTNERLESDGITNIGIITGGFPCQDLSVAGNQKGIHAERSGLWSELCRIIGDIRPAYAIVENVTALISGDNGRWFGKVLGDLAEIGYDCEWHCIPASELGAPHHRDRVWIICYPKHDGSYETAKQGSADGDVSNNKSKRVQGFGAGGQQKPQTYEGQIISLRHCEGFVHAAWDAEPDVGRVVNGLPRRVDRIKGLGNAVVPQIPELIGRAILELQTNSK